MYLCYLAKLLLCKQVGRKYCGRNSGTGSRVFSSQEEKTLQNSTIALKEWRKTKARKLSLMRVPVSLWLAAWRWWSTGWQLPVARTESQSFCNRIGGSHLFYERQRSGTLTPRCSQMTHVTDTLLSLLCKYPRPSQVFDEVTSEISQWAQGWLSTFYLHPATSSRPFQATFCNTTSSESHSRTQLSSFPGSSGTFIPKGRLLLCTKLRWRWKPLVWSSQPSDRCTGTRATAHVRRI